MCGTVGDSCEHMRGSSPDSYAYVRQSLTCVRPRDHRQSLRHFAGRRRWLKAPVTTVARSREVVPRAAKGPTGGGSNHEGSRDDDVNCNRGTGGRRRTTHDEPVRFFRTLWALSNAAAPRHRPPVPLVWPAPGFKSRGSQQHAHVRSRLSAFLPRASRSSTLSIFASRVGR